MVTNNSGPRTQSSRIMIIVQYKLYSITYSIATIHTHTGLLFCLFLCICVLCHFREAKAVFCVFNPFNGGLESSYTSYMCPTLLHCLPVQRIWSEENDPNDLRLIGYHVQFTEGSDFGEKQLSAVCAKKPGSFCPEVCMVIPPVFITLPT